MLTSLKEIEEIASKLYIPEQFGNNEEANGSASIDVLEEQLDDSLNAMYGATKYVITAPEWDAVIKIPFEGVWDYGYDYEDEEPNFYFFNRNYCADEAAIYHDAVEAGFGDIFAATVFGGVTKDKTEYYIAEKVIPFSSLLSETRNHASAHSCRKASEAETRFYVDINLAWLAEAYEWYGDEYVDNLMQFLTDMDINDLHSNNVGIRLDGSPVLLDYSGFYE